LKVEDKSEVGILDLANENTNGYNSELDKDKTSRIINEHRERVGQLIAKQDESMIEPETYKNPHVNLDSSTIIHEIFKGKTSQTNWFKIEIPTTDNATPPKISLASISCTQKNIHEEEVPQT